MDNTEQRRALDAEWTDAVRYCLEQGQWNFAMKAVQAEPAASVTPAFGYTNAFAKPDDFVRLAGISADERFAMPLAAYFDEGAYWYSDADPLFVRYVSDDEDYGLELSRWPETFADYVVLRLAVRVAPRLTIAEGRIEQVKADEKKARIDARSKDAMNEGATFRPTGSWVRARGGSRSGRNYERA